MWDKFLPWLDNKSRLSVGCNLLKNNGDIVKACTQSSYFWDDRVSRPRRRTGGTVARLKYHLRSYFFEDSPDYWRNRGTKEQTWSGRRFYLEARAAEESGVQRRGSNQTSRCSRAEDLNRTLRRWPQTPAACVHLFELPVPPPPPTLVMWCMSWPEWAWPF